MPFVDYQPPIPQCPDFDYIQATFGRLEYGYDHDAVAPWTGWTESDLGEYRVALDMKRISDMKHFSERYNIPGFVSICDLSNVTLTEWLGLDLSGYLSKFGIPTIILEAVVDAVDIKAKAIRDKQEDARRQMELQAINTGTSLNLGRPNSSFGRVYGS